MIDTTHETQEMEVAPTEGMPPAQPSEPFYEAQEPSTLPAVEMDRVKPMSEFDPLNPEQGTRYLDEEAYAAWQKEQGKPEVVPDKVKKDDPLPAVKTEKKDTEAVIVDNPPAPAGVSEWIKEKFGEKFGSEEDLIKFVTAPPPAAPETKWESEEGKQIFELLQAGKTKEVTEYLQLQEYLDSVPKMDDENAIKAMLYFKDPEADDAAIDVDFEIMVGQKPREDQYDDDSKDQYKRDLLVWERKAKMHAKDARAFMESQKKTLAFPKLEQPRFDGVATAELEKYESDFRSDIKTAVEKTIDSFTGIDVRVADKSQGIDYTHKITLSDDDKKALTEAHSDFLESFDKRYMGQGGQYDGAKLARDRFVADNFEKLLASAAKAAYAKGKLSVIKSQSNADMTPAAVAADFDASDYIKAGEAFIEGRSYKK